MRRIDLIPEEAKRLTAKKWLKRYFWKSRALRIAAGAFIALVLLNAWQATSIIRYRIAVGAGKKNIVRLRARVRESQDAAAKIASEREALKRGRGLIEKRLEVLRRSQKERYAWAGVLAHLSGLIPEDLWVKKLELNEELTTIDGTTFNNITVSDFMARLDESDYFKETSFNFTEKSEFTDKEVIDFEVTTHVVHEKIAR